MPDSLWTKVVYNYMLNGDPYEENVILTKPYGDL
jgi:hypothetical protein